MPDIEGLEHRDTVTEWELPAGTFYDLAVVHLLTTATLDRLRELYPAGRFEARRFRPNIVISTAEPGFVENDWLGRTVTVGEHRSPADHATLSALRHDHARARRSSEGSGHSANGGAEQRGQRRRLRRCDLCWCDPPR